MFTGYCWVIKASHEAVHMGDPIFMKPGCPDPQESENTNERIAMLTSILCTP